MDNGRATRTGAPQERFIPNLSSQSLPPDILGQGQGLPLPTTEKQDSRERLAHKHLHPYTAAPSHYLEVPPNLIAAGTAMASNATGDSSSSERDRHRGQTNPAASITCKPTTM